MADDTIAKLVQSAAEARGANIPPELLTEAVQRVMAALGAEAAAPGGGANPAPAGARLDPMRDYPLGKMRPDLVTSQTGKSLSDLALDKVMAGEITFDDVKIRPETLEYQAQIAEGCGRPQLASNIRPAAELTRIPDARVLEIYEALRPYRSTRQELLDIATELEGKYRAKICAAHVREAAEVYEKRNRLKKG